MERAWQTPHGARPNREGARLGAQASAERVPARCASGVPSVGLLARDGVLSKPSGRSLEPRSNARPRGMVVLRCVVPARGTSLQTKFGLQVRLPHFTFVLKRVAGIFVDASEFAFFTTAHLIEEHAFMSGRVGSCICTLRSCRCRLINSVRGRSAG
jgi:hypothetical protein